MARDSAIGVDPKSPAFDSVDEAANALAASFPSKGSETAGMVYKSSDGKFRFSTTIPGSDDHFALRAAVPKGASLAAIVHSHPGKDARGQVFSGDDLKTADQLKLPSYVRFLDGNSVRAYRPGVTKTESMAGVGSVFGQHVAKGDALNLPERKPSADDEYASKLQKNYERNKGYAKEGEYTTALNPGSEAQFRAWVAANKVPFDPNSKTSDYDMRGFWLGLQSKDPTAISAVNPYDKQIHYPDHWKTPYHETFSAESQWAKPGAPTWNKDDQLVLPSGQLIYDSRAAAAKAAPPPDTQTPQEVTPNATR